jgi:hypothetical protein
VAETYRVLVCGGRDFLNRTAVWKKLNDLRSKHGRLTIIQGGARGVDQMAREWCYDQRSVHMINEPAMWLQHGPAAGPIRNQKMLDEHKPDMVLAFPGGRGTADMVSRAEKAGVPIVRCE